MNSRRILIVVIVAALALVVFGLYRLIQSRNATNSTGETAGTLPGGAVPIIPNGTENGGLDTEGAASARASSTKRADQALAYTVNADGTATVVQRDGKIIRVATSSLVTLNNATLTNLVRASFSADGSKALVLTGISANGLKASIFDITTLSWTALPGTYADAAWAPQGATLATLAINPTTGKATITTTSFATTKPKTQTVASLLAQDARITWQRPTALIVYDRPSAYSAGTAWTVDLKTGLITPLIRETMGADILWDPAFDRGLELVGSVANRGGTLSLVSSVGVPVAQLNFLTLPEKCLFAALPLPPAALSSSSSTATTTSTTTSTTVAKKSKTAPPSPPLKHYLACAVPVDQDVLANAALPDQYDQQALFTVDRLVVIDLDTNGIVFVGITPSAVDAVSLRLTPDTLFFVNRYDQALYAVPFQ